MLATKLFQRMYDGPGGGGHSRRADPQGRPLYLESDKATVHAVQRIAADRGVAMATIAMAWVLRNPVVDATIIGATKATT